MNAKVTVNELERRSFTDPVPVKKPDKEEPSVEPSIDTHLPQVKVKSKEDVEERLMLPSFEKQRKVFSPIVEGRFVQLDNEQSLCRRRVSAACKTTDSDCLFRDLSIRSQKSKTEPSETGLGSVRAQLRVIESLYICRVLVSVRGV